MVRILPFQRETHDGRLVADFLPFQFRVGIMDDTAAGLPEERPLLLPHAADSDAHIKIDAFMIQADPADAPGIGAASAPFHGTDDFHGPQFWRAADRSRRKRGGQHVHSVQTVGQTRGHTACQMHDMGKALHIHIPLHPHAAGPRHAPQIVAPEIDKHHVFGLFLGIGPQLGSQPGIFQIVAPATACTGNGRKLEGPGGATHHDFRDEPNSVMPGKAIWNI